VFGTMLSDPDPHKVWTITSIGFAMPVEDRSWVRILHAVTTLRRHGLVRRKQWDGVEYWGPYEIAWPTHNLGVDMAQEVERWLGTAMEAVHRNIGGGRY
jgi:hypothetical protein